MRQSEKSNNRTSLILLCGGIALLDRTVTMQNAPDLWRSPAHYSKNIKYLCILCMMLYLFCSEHKCISLHKSGVDCPPSGCPRISPTWTAGGRHKPSGRPYVERQLHVTLMSWLPDGCLMKPYGLMFWHAWKHRWKMQIYFLFIL